MIEWVLNENFRCDTLWQISSQLTFLKLTWPQTEVKRWLIRSVNGSYWYRWCFCLIFDWWARRMNVWTFTLHKIELQVKVQFGRWHSDLSQSVIPSLAGVCFSPFYLRLKEMQIGVNLSKAGKTVDLIWLRMIQIDCFNLSIASVIVNESWNINLQIEWHWGNDDKMMCQWDWLGALRFDWLLWVKFHIEKTISPWMLGSDRTNNCFTFVLKRSFALNLEFDYLLLLVK
jgi:hypothetical protein